MRLAALGQTCMEIAPSIGAKGDRLAIDKRPICTEAANGLRLAAAHSATGCWTELPNS